MDKTEKFIVLMGKGAFPLLKVDQQHINTLILFHAYHK